MAREPSVVNNDIPVEQDGSSVGNTGLLDRRSYLKLASAAATTAAAAVGTASADDTEYDVITLSTGQRRVFRVGSGETFEKKIIDCSADNCRPVIIAKGTNWTIRNIAIRGRINAQQPDSCFGVADQNGGESLMENIYLGDGAVKGSTSTHQTGIWVDPAHSGHITMRNINVQGFPDNGIYASAPGGKGGGTIHIDSCYGADNWVSTFRLGSTGSRLTNSVWELTSDGYNGRGVWAWAPGPIEVENCHLNARGRHHAIRAGAHSGRTVVTVSNTEYSSGDFSTRGNSEIQLNDGNGTNPASFLPDGVPETAVDAARGVGSSGSPPEDGSDESATESLDQTIVIDGIGTNGVSQYELSVSGVLEPSTDGGASIDDDGTITDGSVSGTVATWRDAFRFSGDIEDLLIDGGARATVNGDPVDPTAYGQTLPHCLTIVGRGVSSSYNFTVDGRVEADSSEPKTEERSIISGSAVEGSIASGVNRYRFSGTITDLAVADGAVHIYLDGDRLDPESVGNEELLPHAIVFDGSDADGSSTYSFTVDGDVIKSTYQEATIDDGDVIDGTTVRGSVANWRDAYWFSGDVTDVSIQGDAAVSTEYNVRQQ